MRTDTLPTVTELSRRIDAGLSPVEIVERCLERIEETNGQVRAMIFVDAAGALDAAQRAEREIRSGLRRSPLHGVPVAVKDMIDVQGWPTTAGSRLFQGRVADESATCIAELQAAGAVVIGKTNLHELCVGGHDNPWFGKVVNPLDPARGTGGTSSGSAAAVAAGFCAAALGTDTGGSNRSPAAATGLYGFKPTNGLVGGRGVLHTAPSLDCVGVIARSVADVRLLTEALLGRPLGALAGRSRAGVTVGLCPALVGDAVDRTVQEAIASLLRREGVRTIELPFDDREAFVAAGLAILQFEFAATYRAGIEHDPERVGDAVRSFLDASVEISASAYRDALALRDAARLRFFQEMRNVDVLAIPTAPGQAPSLLEEATSVNGVSTPWGMAGGRFRRWANMLGVPALAVPLPVSGGLPVSVQLATLPGQDAALLDIAEWLASS